MEMSVTDAKTRLTALVRLAEAGDDIILTRHGQAAVRLVAIKPAPSVESRAELLDSIRRSGAAKAKKGTTASRSQDFLYDDDGLPT
jgi:prevent-host-death family protein